MRNSHPSLRASVSNTPRRKTGLANRHAIGGDLLQLVHQRKIENDAAVQGNALAVIAGARAAHGDGNLMAGRQSA